MNEIGLNNFKREAKERGEAYSVAFIRVLSSGWYILGEEVETFEKNFADYLDVQFCIGVANGLEALQISLMALGVGACDEVITTPISAVATTLAILAVGAKPVFVDTDSNGQLDIDQVEKHLSKKTKVIIPVDLYGMCGDLPRLKKLCERKNIFLIEDSAQGHGSVFQSKKLGTFGYFGCFSFYPTKNLGALGDGGAIVTNNEKLAKIAYELRDYGQESKFLHTKYGINSRLDEVQAAILKVKLQYLDQDNKRRALIANEYMRNLTEVPELSFLGYTKMDFANYHLFVIRTEKRDLLKNYLAAKGIQTAIHFPLLIPEQPFMKLEDYSAYSLKEAQKMIHEILTLPCNPWMTQAEVDSICDAIKKFFTQ